MDWIACRALISINVKTRCVLFLTVEKCVCKAHWLHCSFQVHSMIKATLLIKSMYYWARDNYLCLVIFPSEMHQEHPCLLCREASQGHEGTLSYFHDPFLLPSIFNCNPWSIDLDLIRKLMSGRHGFTVKSILCSFNREPGPRTPPWSVSWCPALRSTCWTSGRPTSTLTGNHCTQPSQ